MVARRERLLSDLCGALLSRTARILTGVLAGFGLIDHRGGPHAPQSLP